MSNCIIANFTLAFLVLATGGAVCQEVQTQSPTFESILKKESASRLSEGDIEEILAIRKRLGGTGLGLESGLELDLRSKLDGVGKLHTGSLAGNSPSKATTVGSPAPSELLFSKMLADATVSQINFNLPRNTASDSTAAGNETVSLRSIARKIEQLAADMEEFDLFEEADRLRDQASRIRQKTRQQVRQAKNQTRRLR